MLEHIFPSMEDDAITWKFLKIQIFQIPFWPIQNTDVPTAKGTTLTDISTHKLFCFTFGMPFSEIQCLKAT